MPKTSWLLLLFGAFAPAVAAQNLIQNAGFERHEPLDCIPCHTEPQNFSGTMKPWRTLPSGAAHICDCNYKRNQDEIRSGLCRFDKVQPQEGCVMMELRYHPSCLDFDHASRGCGSYLGTRFEEPLEVGQVYEVSCWINILEAPDSAFARHIGISFYPDVVRNPRGKMLEGPAFPIDTVIFNRWYRVKWYVRPICRLRFFLLGVFRGKDGPPVHRKGTVNVFYVDQVSVKKVGENEANTAAVTPFCRLKEAPEQEMPREIEDLTCYFSSGDSALLPEARTALDSFAGRVKQQPGSAFVVGGHTDEVGTNHESLSHARVESVLRYLEDKHRLPRFRFIALGFGNSRPAAPHTTETGRQANRRVEIRQTDASAAGVIYRNLLSQVFDGHKEAAFKALNAWLFAADDRHKILIINDIRLEPLKKDPRWAAVAKRVKESYRSLKQPALAYTLDSLWAEDQKSRTLKYYIENLGAYFPDIDSTDRRWDVNFPPDTGTDSDQEHFKILEKLIGKDDWPKISAVGERPAKAAFLIVNHTMDTVVLSRYLPLIEKRCLEGEAEWLHYATMYDRLMTLKGRPQRYGTQYKQLDGKKEKYELFPLEDAARVNEWRRELGLEEME